jgi:hypothetical protein
LAECNQQWNKAITPVASHPTWWIFWHWEGVGACGSLGAQELWLISLFGGKHGAISRFVLGDAALREIWVKQMPLVGKIGGNPVSCGTFLFSVNRLGTGRKKQPNPT